MERSRTAALIAARELFLEWGSSAVTHTGVASRIVDKVGVRLPLLIGPAGTMAGLLWLSRLTVTSSYADVIGPLLIIAVGMGLSFVPLTLSAVAGVAAHEAGLASALLNTAQQVGGALGLAVLATVAIDATKHSLAKAAAAHGHVGAAAGAVATTHGYNTAFGDDTGLVVRRDPGGQAGAPPDGDADGFELLGEVGPSHPVGRLGAAVR